MVNSWGKRGVLGVCEWSWGSKTFGRLFILIDARIVRLVLWFTILIRLRNLENGQVMHWMVGWVREKKESLRGKKAVNDVGTILKYTPDKSKTSYKSLASLDGAKEMAYREHWWRTLHIEDHMREIRRRWSIRWSQRSVGRQGVFSKWCLFCLRLQCDFQEVQSPCFWKFIL